MSELSGLALLATGFIGASIVANALLPIRSSPIVLVSWPLAWLVTELAAHVLVLALVLALLLILVGALGATAGWIGLGLVAIEVLGCLLLVWRSRGTIVTIDPALAEFAGDPALRYPRSHIAFPLLAWRRRDIATTRGVRYGPSGWQTLDVYQPRIIDGPRRPAIINIHGGGWVLGSRHEQGIPLLGHLAASGWVGFNIDYRLAPKYRWPAQIVDVKSAIVWVREHADEFHIDPNYLAITGGSAGGHLSSLAALTAHVPEYQPGFEEKDTSVSACVSFYGVYDMVDENNRHSVLLRTVMDRILFHRKRSENQVELAASSPMNRISADAPPFFVIHGSADSLIPVEESRLFVQRLRAESSSPAHYAEIHGGQHAFDVFPSWRTLPVIHATQKFLDKNFASHLESSANSTRIPDSNERHAGEPRNICHGTQDATGTVPPAC